MPLFAKRTYYNHLVLGFWNSTGPTDALVVWSDPIKYFGDSSQFGSSKTEIQKNFKTIFKDFGIKLMVGAFGTTEHPTTVWVEPMELAGNLSKFVMENNLDGVDVDWEDNEAMKNGKGVDWLVRFSAVLRQNLPSHIISHSPQAPYFVACNTPLPCNISYL